MFICGKQIRFGYKNWVLASCDGYPFKFKTCTRAREAENSSKSLGYQVVTFLVVVTFLLSKKSFLSLRSF